jgi:CRISPR-associated protein Cas1
MEQGARLVKNHDRIEVKKEEQLLESIPVFALEQIILFGNVALTANLRNFLLDQAVDTVFLTHGGRFRGRLTSYSGSNVALRQQQFRKCDDDSFVLHTARLFVEGKLQNSRTLLRRHQRRLQDQALAQALLRIRNIIGKLPRAESLDQLRGYEGEAAAVYFGCLSKVLKQPEFHFTKRSRRPPKDPFNAVLSFGYTMLLGTVMAAVQTVGLEPYLGFLHAPSNRKPSVGLDLMEEFRSLLVDALAVRMVNRRQFDINDFEYRDVPALEGQDEDGQNDDKKLSPTDYPVLMGRLSIRKWLAIYNRELERTLEYPRFGNKLTFKQIILEQCRLLARHIKGEEEYQAFSVR